MSGSLRGRPGTALHRFRGEKLRDEGEQPREVPVVVLCPAWKMLDPEGPLGGSAGDLAWLAADTDDEDVQIGPLWRHRPRSVVPRGSEKGASRLTTWRHTTAGPSPLRHPTLS